MAISLFSYFLRRQLSFFCNSFPISNQTFKMLLFLRVQNVCFDSFAQEIARKKPTKSAPHKGKKDAKKLEFFCKTQVLQFSHINQKSVVQSQLNFTLTHIHLSVTFRNCASNMLRLKSVQTYENLLCWDFLKRNNYNI